MLKVLPPDVQPWDFYRIVAPTIQHFRRGMRGAFAGREVQIQTMELYCELAEEDNMIAAAEWLYCPNV